MTIDIREKVEFRKRPSKHYNLPESLIKYELHFLSEQKDLELVCTYGTHARKMVHYLSKHGIKAKANIL